MGHDDDIDPDFVGNGNVTQAEMHDYVVISYDGYFAKEQSKKHDFFQEQEQAVEEIFTSQDPCHHGYIRFLNVENALITLGNGDISQGLELAVRFLSKGQCAIVCSHFKYAHPHGRKNACISTACTDMDPKDQVLVDYNHDLPPYTHVIYRVYLKSIKSSLENQTYEFRSKLANQLKLIGNDYFTNEWKGPHGGFGKSKSLKAYNNATKELLSLMNDLGEQQAKAESTALVDYDKMKDQIEALLVDCFNNVSAVFLRDKEYVKAKEAATQAIQINPNNVKALKRAAKASLLSCSFEESYAALQVAMELKQDDVEILKLKAEYEKRLKEYQQKEKAMYARMMNAKKNHGASGQVGMKLHNGENDISGCETSSVFAGNENSGKSSNTRNQTPHKEFGAGVQVTSTPGGENDTCFKEMERNVWPNWLFGMGVIVLVFLGLLIFKGITHLDMTVPEEEL